LVEITTKVEVSEHRREKSKRVVEEFKGKVSEGRGEGLGGLGEFLWKSEVGGRGWYGFVGWDLSYFGGIDKGVLSCGNSVLQIE
jgi:hypothetical protein